MKTRYKVNILFVLNAGIVAFLSIGAAYFTLGPLIMFERDFFTVVNMATQNYAMIGLWLIYFINIIFLPITLKKRDKKWKIGYVIFLICIVTFITFILV